MFNKKVRAGLLVLAAVGMIALLLGCGAQVQAGGGGTLRSATYTAAGDNAYTINVSGSGLASSTPDIVDVQLGVEAVTDEAAPAISESTTKMQAVLAAVKALGVEDKDIQTVNYSMWVEQIYNPETGIPTGQVRYHVTNQISVRLRDLTQAGKLLESALAAGANNVGSITFGVSDSTELQKQARALAVQNARAKADELAAGLGVRVGKVRSVSEYVSSPIPVAAYAKDMGMGGGGEVPIASGAYNVTVEVQVIFDIIQ
ncbi:MAG TPA: SIMPL domain-containing protein [Anaerolineae bacterium]|nr:SIMPL domain-containing protein [Anaerolineae bacterium]HQI84538.1 SIMPL domain-containing protein [Anaerolineae bacterium]